MTPDAIPGTVLDHVAHAVHRWGDVWHRYAAALGAEWVSGGPGPGFAPGQLQFANHARVEVLMPHDTHANDFLARFLDSNGPGPHHLTFKVPDIGEALDEARRHGYEPIGIDLTQPDWLEAFLHPKLATGVVVQLAESPAPWSSAPPDDYPTDLRQRSDGGGPVPPADLVWVTHAVADLDSALSLFAGLLGGAVVAEGSQGSVRWVHLAWPGPLGIRLVAPDTASADAPLHRWLGDLPGRVHHLDLTVDEPGGVDGARPFRPSDDGRALVPDADHWWEVPAAQNSGLALVLRPRP